jgi:hypothetical protein
MATGQEPPLRSDVLGSTVVWSEIDGSIHIEIDRDKAEMQRDPKSTESREIIRIVSRTSKYKSSDLSRFQSSDLSE